MKRELGQPNTKRVASPITHQVMYAGSFLNSANHRSFLFFGRNPVPLVLDSHFSFSSKKAITDCPTMSFVSTETSPLAGGWPFWETFHQLHQSRSTPCRALLDRPEKQVCVWSLQKKSVHFLQILTMFLVLGQSRINFLRHFHFSSHWVTASSQLSRAASQSPNVSESLMFHLIMIF